MFISIFGCARSSRWHEVLLWLWHTDWVVACRLGSCSPRAQWLCFLWDLSSPATDRSHVPCIGSRFLTTGPPGKVPKICFKYSSVYMSIPKSQFNAPPKECCLFDDCVPRGEKSLNGLRTLAFTHLYAPWAKKEFHSMKNFPVLIWFCTAAVRNSESLDAPQRLCLVVIIPTWRNSPVWLPASSTTTICVLGATERPPNRLLAVQTVCDSPWKFSLDGCRKHPRASYIEGWRVGKQKRTKLCDEKQNHWPKEDHIFLQTRQLQLSPYYSEITKKLPFFLEKFLMICDEGRANPLISLILSFDSYRTLPLSQFLTPSCPELRLICISFYSDILNSYFSFSQVRLDSLP